MKTEKKSGAAGRLRHMACKQCEAPCEQNCVLTKREEAVKIKRIMLRLGEAPKVQQDRKHSPIDLSADLCGIRLENPFLLSSSVVASSYEMCAKAFDMGWAGAAFKTICMFAQHEASPRFSALKARNQSFYGFKNIEQLSSNSVEDDLNVFRQLKKNYPTKVIVASIMGRNEEEWSYLAEECERAGADVIECNFSCPNMESHSLGATIGQSPELTERFTRAAKKGCSIPVLAK